MRRGAVTSKVLRDAEARAFWFAYGYRGKPEDTFDISPMLKVPGTPRSEKSSSKRLRCASAHAWLSLGHNQCCSLFFFQPAHVQWRKRAMCRDDAQLQLTKRQQTQVMPWPNQCCGLLFQAHPQAIESWWHYNLHASEVSARTVYLLVWWLFSALGSKVKETYWNDGSLAKGLALLLLLPNPVILYRKVPST